MNEIKFENYKFTFKYLSNEPIVGERIKFDGYRAFIVSDDKKHKIYFELLGTDYNSKIDDNQTDINEIIQNKYGYLENCFYQIAIRYLKERISQNSLKNGEVNIKNYL